MGALGIEEKAERHRKANRLWARKKYARLRQDPEFLARRKRDKQLYRERHSARLKEDNHNQYWRIRSQVLALYGGRCAQCGFSDERALQIDHVNGGGAQQKKRIGSTMIYKRAIVVYGTGEYQLLCANCNWIKAYEAYEKERNVAINQSPV